MPAHRNALIDGIAAQPPAHLGPAKTEFQPWHRPRKQWVRNHQWGSQGEDLFRQLQLDGRPVRYLSLPGADMLDIRVFAAICRRVGVELKCLGFDDGVQPHETGTERSISWNEVSNQIRETSVILQDSFQVLSDKNATAFSHVRQIGPFDVINLDFCKSLSSPRQPQTHQALFNILEFQVDKRREPWLLFITTRADSGSVDDHPLEHYVKNIATNIDGSPEFRDGLASLIRSTAPRSKDTTSKWCRDLPREVFPKVFGLGVGKWLLGVLSGGAARWKLEMLQSVWYRVESASIPNMLSLAFLMTPEAIVLEDPSQLIDSTQPARVLEHSLATELVRQAGSLLDVDDLLGSDSDLLSRAIQESAELLQTARYDVTHYPAWAMKNTPRLKKSLRNTTS